MEHKSKVTILSVLIALVALLLLVSSIAIVEISQKKKASVENLIDPFVSLDDGSSGFIGTNIQVFDNSGSSSSDDDEDDDTDAPSSISGLISSDIGSGYIYWEWANPTDSDFYRNRIYLNGAYMTSTSNNFYNATGLTSETNYTITIHTMDTNANVNTTDINDTQTTLPEGTGSPNSPVITPIIPDISFDEDTTDDTLILDDYVTDPDTALIDLTWSYSGNTNITVSIDDLDSNRVTFSPVGDWNGVETITIRVEDLEGNWDEQAVVITVNPIDNTAPTLTSALPNQTLNEDVNINDAFNLESYFDDAEDGSAGLIYSVVLQTNTSVVTATIDLTNNVDITTLANQYGVSDVTIRATDLAGLFVEDTFTITVNQLNDDCIIVRSLGSEYELCN